MGREGRALKVILIIFLFCILVQGSYAAEEPEINTSSNDAMNTKSDTQTFQWSLLVPIFLGSLLFISWMCRFFDRMGYCFVLFLALVICGALLFLFGLFDYIRTVINYPFVALIFLFIAIVTLSVVENPLPKVRSFIIILAVLTWPSILLYFYINGIVYVTFYGIEKLKFPVYIIAASYIGILSYLLLSIEEIFGHLVPEYQKLRVAWSYLKRILIAPFIAIIGFYLLNSLQNKNVNEINDYFVFAFAFFAGVFTKTIEEWIYSTVQKLLPADRKDELSSKSIEVKESDFVKKLHFDEDVAYKLYNAKIRKIDELADCDPCELIKKLNTDTRQIGEEETYTIEKSCQINGQENKQAQINSYSWKQAESYINTAKKCRGIDRSEFVTNLKMDRNVALMLYFANITTIEKLSELDPNNVREILCFCNEQTKNSEQSKSDQYMEAQKILCNYYEKEIKEFIEKAKKINEKRKENN